MVLWRRQTLVHPDPECPGQRAATCDAFAGRLLGQNAENTGNLLDIDALAVIAPTFSLLSGHDFDDEVLGRRPSEMVEMVAMAHAIRPVRHPLQAPSHPLNREMATGEAASEEPSPTAMPSASTANGGLPSVADVATTPSSPDAPPTSRDPEEPVGASRKDTTNEMDDEPNYGLITQVKQTVATPSPVSPTRVPTIQRKYLPLARILGYRSAHILCLPGAAPAQATGPPRQAATPVKRPAAPRREGLFSSLFACCSCGTAEDIHSDHVGSASISGRVEGVAGIPGKAEADAARFKGAEPAGSAVSGSVADFSEAGKQTTERKWLLRPLAPGDRGKKCLVLDLDETLVHSSFKVRRPELACMFCSG